ncbi:MAG: F0F1 ATP synthase subunit A [Lachnospiraceae bacterium]|nr:F0F1 ATP synthase subunit A [Lachnospiraceae bacterium]
MGNGILLSEGANIDFMIKGVFSYELFGQTVWITTSHVCILIVMLIIIGFCIAANRRMKKATEVPDGFQNVLELIVEKLDGMVTSVMGGHAVYFRNYIGTIFIFILLSNISGLLGLRPPTADYGTTFALGIMTFTLITFNKFKYQKPIGVLKGLCDPWVFWLPINLIGDFAVPISISLRLFANVLSGTVIMALIYGLMSKVALVWPAALHVYFDLFSGAIQTYVFCMLTMTYITDARTVSEE